MDIEAMMLMMRQSMAQAQEFGMTDDPETTATKLRLNDATLKSLVIGPTLPDSLSCVIQKRLPPERYLPESERDEWRSVGEQIGAHGNIEELEISNLEYEPQSNLEAMLTGVAKNRSIRCLRFDSSDIGRWAFDIIAPMLASNVNLRKVEVSNCYLNDPFLAFAPVLNSSTLEEIQVIGNQNPEDFTTEGLEKMEQCLCDTTSIEATYLSNHKLFKVSVYNESEDGMSERLVELPTNLSESLKLNKNTNKGHVAREKILRSHFSGNEFRLDPFEEDSMDLQVLPFVLSWLGRHDGLGPAPDDRSLSLMTGCITSTPGRENVCSQSAMFEFLRRMPKRIFESDSAKGKKRPAAGGATASQSKEASAFGAAFTFGTASADARSSASTAEGTASTNAPFSFGSSSPQHTSTATAPFNFKELTSSSGAGFSFGAASAGATTNVPATTAVPTPATFVFGSSTQPTPSPQTDSFVAGATAPAPAPAAPTATSFSFSPTHAPYSFLDGATQTSTSFCAAHCGSKGLKTCSRCHEVKYCSRECQVTHWPKHKKACKKRAEELLDEKLFQDPPPREECPICLEPLPMEAERNSWRPCCGKIICLTCTRTADIKCRVTLAQIGRLHISESPPCPLCRVRSPKDEKEMDERCEKRMVLNDPEAFMQRGGDYSVGTSTTQVDWVRAFELYTRAVELGSVEAHYELGNIHRHGKGRDVNMRKAKYHYKMGAIGGCLKARTNLAITEAQQGNVLQAMKHFKISARNGYAKGMEGLQLGYEKGFLTKDELDESLLAYEAAIKDMKSD